MFFLSLFGFAPPTFWSVLVLILILTAPQGLFHAPEPRGFGAAPGRAHRMYVRRRGGWFWRVPTAA